MIQWVLCGLILAKTHCSNGGQSQRPERHPSHATTNFPPSLCALRSLGQDAHPCWAWASRSRCRASDGRTDGRAAHGQTAWSWRDSEPSVLGSRRELRAILGLRLGSQRSHSESPPQRPCQRRTTSEAKPATQRSQTFGGEPLKDASSAWRRFSPPKEEGSLFLTPGPHASSAREPKHGRRHGPSLYRALARSR